MQNSDRDRKLGYVAAEPDRFTRHRYGSRRDDRIRGIQMTDLHSEARRAARSGRPSTRPLVTMAVGSVYRDMNTSVSERLADLVRIADNSGGDEPAELGRSQVPKLVSALRELLAEHEPDAHGRCRTCRRGWLRRRRPAPCRAYLSAYLCLALPAPEEPAESRRYRGHRY